MITSKRIKHQFYLALIAFLWPALAIANTLDPQTSKECSNHLMICELDRFQTLVSATFVLLAAFIAFRGAIKSARLESAAALESAKLSAKATADATKETMAQNLQSLERQIEEDQKVRDEQRADKIERFHSFFKTTITQADREFDELLRDAKRQKEFQEHTDVLLMRDTVSSVTEQLSEVQTLSLEYEISPEIRQQIAEILLILRKSHRAWLREFGSVSDRDVRLASDSHFIATITTSLFSLREANTEFSSKDKND